MRKVTLSGHVVEIYDAIDELPMRRFHRYNKMVLVDAGIGSDLSALDAHLEKAAMFIKDKTPELAQKELENLRQCVYFIHTGLSPRSLAFAVLVKSIDGKPCDDMSDKALQEVSERLSGVSVRETAALFEAVKKLAPSQDIIIKAAAVADFRPKNPKDEKIKKKNSSNVISAALCQAAVVHGQGQRGNCL